MTVCCIRNLVQKAWDYRWVEGGINSVGNPYDYQGPMLFIADLMYDPSTKRMPLLKRWMG